LDDNSFAAHAAAVGGVRSFAHILSRKWQKMVRPKSACAYCQWQMLNWDKKYETGHARIDAQHQMLFTYLNELEALAGGKGAFPGPDDFRSYFKFIDFLEDYALTHFREEENCMHRFRCPAHERNLLAHADFKEFFRNFKRKSRNQGYRQELVRELHECCVQWIEQHILEVDTSLKPCQTPMEP
jgi:hemerythrin